MTKPAPFTQHDILQAAIDKGFPAGFVSSLRVVLPEEGIVDENVQGDSGGDTRCGVDQPDFNVWLDRNQSPRRSVFTATTSDIASCYYGNHWVPMHCGDLDQRVALALFDSSVNQGNGGAVQCLQHALGVKIDGVLGNGTLSAEHVYVVAHGPLAMALSILAWRRLRYQHTAAANPDDQQFLTDWLRRCDDIEVACKAIK